MSELVEMEYLGFSSETLYIGISKWSEPSSQQIFVGYIVSTRMYAYSV